MQAVRAREISDAIGVMFRDGFGSVDLLTTPKGMLPDAPPAQGLAAPA